MSVQGQINDFNVLLFIKMTSFMILTLRIKIILKYKVIGEHANTLFDGKMKFSRFLKFLTLGHEFLKSILCV